MVRVRNVKDTAFSGGSMQLDSARLNPFRVLVCSRFHIESSAEKEKKKWKSIKGKTRCRCGVKKHVNQHRKEKIN